MLLLLLMPLLAFGQNGSDRQIIEAVDRHLNERLQREAKRQGWQGARLTHDTSLPASAARLPRCDQPLQVRPAGSSPSLLERQRLAVRCPGENGWTLELTSQAGVWLPTVHAQGIIERGQTIAGSDLRLEPIDIARAQRGYFHRLEEVQGMAAKRRIRAGQTLTPSLLAQPLAVKRGQPVKIIASNDGIEASTSGEALADGQPGEVIRVRNVRSGKVIDAQVVKEGVVSSTF
ncbi:flagellar basal body P-ring formation chaperone FlgA [Stutzerimonas frequens]|uniref:Flagella basal body P-ring formation protein FlgA n=1 Tax=Stutzerimonas frequens TaxID=2968969 RepID=A0AA47E280_9GAMM|nr:flagellar basal body P-ring formation chaperone FlgA [Stutzerimonas frequens]WAE52820.1 flagellar basal body P-ring formation chaperone FlgA [Stutzerimonas frequens]